MQDATDYTGHGKPAMQDATAYGWSPVMPAWQARAEQAQRDQVARDRAAQDRFYAGPMAATYGDDGR